jgi:hypothetical protein
MKTDFRGSNPEEFFMNGIDQSFFFLIKHTDTFFSAYVKDI